MDAKGDENSPDENPFENIPSELSYDSSKSAKKAVSKTSVSADEFDDELDDYLYEDRVSKSTLALVSGLGFVFIAVIIYFFTTRYTDLYSSGSRRGEDTSYRACSWARWPC
jgi:hypothetical protein